MGKMHTGWPFLAEHGFHGSAGKTAVKGYMRGGHVKKAVGAVKAPQKGPVHGSAPPAANVHRSVGKTTPHPYAKGGPAHADGIAPRPSSGKVQGGPSVRTPSAGGNLRFAKGGKFKPEDQEKHESQTGFAHHDVEKPGKHYEAKRGGHLHKAKGGPVSGRNGGGFAHPESSHFLPEHRIVSTPIGLSHPKHGHAAKHHATPHKPHGHKEFAKGGSTRPMGMPRAPMIGMKRVRHGPGQKQMPGIPGMPPVGTSPLGLGAGTAPRVMKRGGRS